MQANMLIQQNFNDSEKQKNNTVIMLFAGFKSEPHKGSNRTT